MTSATLVKSAFAEFLGCWVAGGEASLSLSTLGGKLTFTTTNSLGRPEAPLHPTPTPPHPAGRRRPNRGPSKRARDNLRAARHQAARAPSTPSSPSPSSTSMAPVEEEVPSSLPPPSSPSPPLSPPTPSTPTPSAPSPSTTSTDPTTHPTQLITTLPPAPQEWTSDSLQLGVGVRLVRPPRIPQLDGAVASPAPSAPSTTNTTPPPPRYVPPYRRNEAQGLWTDYVDDI